MNNFYNVEYLSERVACVCAERDALKRENDALKREVADLKDVVGRQLRLNRSCAVMAMELDKVTAERDALLRAGGNHEISE